MRLQFCGAAQEVTGSNHVVQVGGRTILLDFGLIQGGHEQHERNRKDPPYDPSSVAAVVLSHAHVDHCGRLPLLWKRGFRGPIYATQATCELTRLLLLDSAHIQEEDVRWKRKRLKKQKRDDDWVQPLYSIGEAEETLALMLPISYAEQFEVTDGVQCTFRDAGHILGSASEELSIREGATETKLVFSGDVGRPNTPILRDPEWIEHADLLIVESTYGDRLHKNGNRQQVLGDVIRRTVARGGHVIIPAFAVGRTQELIYELNHLMASGNLPAMPIYVDSPMALQATDLLARHEEVYDSITADEVRVGRRPMSFKNLRIVQTVDESKAINEDRSPCVIIAASGMCNAGRIKHHLRNNLGNSRNTVLFVSYQAVGTLGRLIKDGLPEVRIFGDLVHVQADIQSVDGYSAHADRDELLAWLKGFKQPPKKTFVVHGERDVSFSFAKTIQQQLGWEATVPKLLEEFSFT